MSFDTLHSEFPQLVEEYCDAIEQLTKDPRQTLCRIREKLLRLYLYTVELQMPESKDLSFDDLPETLRLDDQKKIADTLADYTGSNFFWQIYEPFTTPHEDPVRSSLSSNLAEIWWDLKPGLLALKMDRAKWAQDVFWDWKFNFDIHWGDHAVDSIWAIHKLLRDLPPEVNK